MNTEIPPSAKPSRHVGIELFRIVAMILIVLLHVLGRGGVYGNTVYLSANYKLAWFLEIMAYCSVNCYALISGFVGVTSRFRFRKLVYLWLEVAFITVSTTAICAIFAPAGTVSADDWLKAFFPLTKREYWYFNAYAMMFPFLPLLNTGLHKLGRRRHLTAMVFLLVLSTILPMLGDRDLFELASGYSCLWLMILYVFGAYFRLYGVPKLAHPAVCLFLFFGATLVAWGQKIQLIPWGEPGVLVGYTSPCMVIMALALLWLFAQVRIQSTTAGHIIGLFGKATFGVFLVHVGAMVWNMIDDHWARYAYLAPWQMVLAVLGTTLAVYLICSAYSLLRIWLFQLCRVHRGVDRLAELLTPSENAEEQKNS